MIELANKVSFVDDTFAAAEVALDNPEVIKRLGLRVDRMSLDLARLVPVISSSDAERLPKLLDPDSVPFLVIDPTEAIHFEAGINQFSNNQRASARGNIQSWNPAQHSPEEAVDRLESIRKKVPAAEPYHEFTDKARAAMSTEDIFMTTGQFINELTLQNGPEGRLVRLTYRGVLCAYMNSRQNHLSTAALAHELTHLTQREDRPVNIYSSQKDFDSEALRTELEAYHVGATVAAAIEDKEISEMDMYDSDGRPKQSLVEKLRLLSKQYDPSDPFRPNRMLTMLLDNAGVDLDILMMSWVNIEKILANLSSQ